MTVRMRHTRSHTKNRRSHHALSKRVVIEDTESGKIRLPHRLDENTGMYRGKLIVPPKEKRVTKTEKAKKEEQEEKAVGTHEPVHMDAASVKDEKKSAGLIGRMMKGRAQARSGTGS